MQYRAVYQHIADGRTIPGPVCHGGGRPRGSPALRGHFGRVQTPAAGSRSNLYLYRVQLGFVSAILPDLDLDQILALVGRERALLPASK